MYTINIEVNGVFKRRIHCENTEDYDKYLEVLKQEYSHTLWFIFDSDSKHPTFSITTQEGW